MDIKKILSLVGCLAELYKILSEETYDMDYQTFKEIVIERLLMCLPESGCSGDD